MRHTRKDEPPAVPAFLRNPGGVLLQLG